MLFGTLGCSEAQATSDQRPATQRQLPSEISVGHGDIGWDADASRGAELAELAVTLSPSLFQLFLLYLYPVRYPLSTTLHGLASFRSQAQRAAAGCRRLQAFALSPECSLLLDAAHCCWLLSPLSRPLRTTRTRPSKLLRPIFSLWPAAQRDYQDPCL